MALFSRWGRYPHPSRTVSTTGFVRCAIALLGLQGGAAGEPFAPLRAGLAAVHFTANAERPGNLAAVPNSSSMRRSWLYLATRSLREPEPVLICPQPRGTTKAAMKASSVSPERCETMAV